MGFLLILSSLAMCIGIALVHDDDVPKWQMHVLWGIQATLGVLGLVKLFG